ncbi:MAG: hydantoinase B/oxoprolinase family protein [Dehalococcoidia bacterium]
MTIDPITLEIVRGRLRSIILEMEALVERTAMSPMIKEKKDYFVGVYDSGGRIVDAYLSLSGPQMVAPVLEEYPIETMEPGDLFWYNDPHLSRGAIQHSGDMCFCTPVFAGGHVVAFAVSFGHFWDIGGTVPGSLSPLSSEIFHEGILVPPIRIMHHGELNRDAYRVILRNSRFPDLLEGDTRALMAACRLAETRLNELFDRYGEAMAQEAFDEIIEQSRVTGRRLLRDLLPEGEYHFYDYVDRDPVDGQPRRIDLRLLRVGDHITVDLTGSGPQAKGPVNFITSEGALNLMLGRYLASIEPSIALNEGVCSLVDEVLTKPGTVVYPDFPAPVGLRSHTAIRMMGSIMGVLGQGNDGQSSAGSPVYVIYSVRSWDDDAGKYLYASEGVGSGQGARPFADGVDAIYFRDQKNYPIEFVEREFPLRVERYSIRSDSGGPGLHRGGCGVIRDIRLLVPSCILSTRMDNVRFPCFGAKGGGASRVGRFTVNPCQAGQRDLSPTAEDVQLTQGDLLRVETGGGGGWGDPYERPAKVVQWDVINGFVSLVGASLDYGVVLDAKTLTVDTEKTEKIRGTPRPPRPTFDRGPEGEEWLRRVADGNQSIDTEIPAASHQPA